ncbi:MAG: hypothetical protein H6867_07290 [Rhodospirillales bacterium]|nr:hypothetical protein [Rhodospirillales bacterium]MCB9995355.1 hypothetical protein [Rhodospirillales bacterium]
MTGTTLNTNDPERLQAIFNRLSQIDEGRAIVDFIHDNNIKVQFNSQDVGFAQNVVIVHEIKDTAFICSDHSVHFNTKLNDDNIIQALAHEAQHLMHHINHLGNPDFWPSDEDHCLIRRVQEADAQRMATRISCLLKRIGDDGPYREVQKTEFAHMLNPFEATAEEDEAALYDGRADRAAFDSWFTNNANLRFYDRDAVTNQVSFLKKIIWDSPNHTIRPGTLTEEWLHRIGDLSPVNYMTLPGTPSVLSEHYRRNIAKNIQLFPDP